MLEFSTFYIALHNRKLGDMLDAWPGYPVPNNIS